MSASSNLHIRLARSMHSILAFSMHSLLLRKLTADSLYKFYKRVILQLLCQGFGY